MRQKQEAIQHQHAYEMAQKDNKIRELNQEIMLLQRQSENSTERLCEELEMAKDQIGQLQKNEAIIEVYKKKLE